ncbi:MAG: hypothetical protein ABJD07_16230, partial [Gemmatimonadaceae bacterium]
LARARRVLLFAALGGAALAAALAWQLRDRGDDAELVTAPQARAPVKTRTLADTTSPAAAPTVAAPAPAATMAAAPPPHAAPSPGSRPARQTRHSPVIAQGTTELGGGMVALRTGDTVAVTFDHPMMRTRRPEKFEQIVRSTVAGIYGAGADSLIRALPDGAVARAGDLMNDLPTRGLQLALADGDTLTVWPTVRRGRDGMLVVAYRAVVR